MSFLTNSHTAASPVDQEKDCMSHTRVCEIRPCIFPQGVRHSAAFAVRVHVRVVAWKDFHYYLFSKQQRDALGLGWLLGRRGFLLSATATVPSAFALVSNNQTKRYMPQYWNAQTQHQPSQPRGARG